MQTKFLLALLTVTLLLGAGCTTTSPGTMTTVPTATPIPAYTVPAGALPMNTSVTFGNATHSIQASVNSFEISPATEPGSHPVTIYIAANNTGKDPIRFVWFSKLTDLSGISYGGIGISHGGNGARSEWILPNKSEAARDYVIVNSDAGLASLAKGAVLDVYFFEQKANMTHSVLPDYHVTWVIDPDTIK